jgi:competence protein ComEA
MKRAVTAFLSFSRMERLAICVLCAVVLLYMTVKYTMAMWVAPPANDAEQKRLNEAYLAWKAKEDLANPADGYAEASPAAVETALFPFDPNTLDSVGFLRLGMPQRAVKGLMNWRRKGKRFYKPEDLKPLYNLPEDVYAQLLPYIRIEAGNDYEGKWSSGKYNSFPAIPAVIDLNSVDSAILDRGVPGIGSTLAHKILQRRAALGGFIRHEQILEVYKFPDTTFQRMKEKLKINAAAVRKMHLNSVSLEQMSAHPYVGEKLAKNIIMYREGIKQYESLEQLRQVPLMNEEIYRKIAPYFVVE